MKAKLAVLGLSVALAMQAAPVAIQNASFETHDPFTVTNTSFGSWNFTVPDWDIAPSGFTAGSFTPVPAALSPIATDGSVEVFVINGSISQTLTALVTQGTTYTLTVDSGHAHGDISAGYAIGLFVGTTQLAGFSHPNPLAGFGWFTDSVTYSSPIGDPNAGQPLTIVLTSFGTEALFDNVRLDAEAAPEPGSLMLAALGTALLLGARAIRRRAI
jgi:hypothetical protein